MCFNIKKFWGKARGKEMSSHDVTRAVKQAVRDEISCQWPPGWPFYFCYPPTDKARLSPFSANWEHCVFLASAFKFSCFLAKSVVKWSSFD